MTDQEYREELKRDPQLRRAIAVVNKHYGARPNRNWWRVAAWVSGVIGAVILLWALFS